MIQFKLEQKLFKCKRDLIFAFNKPTINHQRFNDANTIKSKLANKRCLINNNNLWDIHLFIDFIQTHTNV